MTDPFAVLGLTRDATLQDVRSARRVLARTLHPDVGGDPIRMQEVNVAFEAAVAHITGRRPLPAAGPGSRSTGGAASTSGSSSGGASGSGGDGTPGAAATGGSDGASGAAGTWGPDGAWAAGPWRASSAGGWTGASGANGAFGRRRRVVYRPSGAPRVQHDIPSFTIDALPAEAFEALLVVASWIGEVAVDDPPYLLEARLDDPVPCWCRLELVPDAGASTVSLTVAFDVPPSDGVDAETVRDTWVANLNRLGRDPA